jgi:N-acyl-D-amino-acid deacylase
MKHFLLLMSLAAQAQNYDILLRNGTVIDGTGAPSRRADVAIRKGYIHEVGDLKNATATTVLDVRGLVVAPGFLNIHSHATAEGISTAANMLTQGVTTEIINADGASSIDIKKQLAFFSERGLALNLGAYIGFNGVWAAVVGQADRRPTAEEIQKMRDLITANLKAGAWGVSAGLDYKPGYFARREEVIEVMKAAAPFRTNFPNHDRLTPESSFSSLAAIAETIEIGEKAGVMPVITHMKVQGKEQGGASKAIAMMREAEKRGHPTVADIYPYLAGQTGLGSLFVPAWAVSGGREEMLKRFRDPEQRARIAREIEVALEARILTPENIDIPSKGRKFTAYMKDFNAGAGETMIRILEKEHPSAIMKFGAEADLIELLRFPGTSVSCDCGAIPPNLGPGVHPRYYGTFPRVLGRYVRETKVLTLEDAVRKMSGLPASIIGIANRGFLAPGMAADVTVFDPATVIDHATYETPTGVSTGVRHVIVNGSIALREGKAEGNPSGTLLMRDAVSLLSRTTNVAVARGPGKFVDPKSKTEIRLLRIGILQRQGEWSSFTAIAEIGGETHAILVIAENGTRIEVDDGRVFEIPRRKN